MDIRRTMVRLEGETSHSCALISAVVYDTGAVVWFGYSENPKHAAASQLVKASDCRELVEFFTELAKELEGK